MLLQPRLKSTCSGKKFLLLTHFFHTYSYSQLEDLSTIEEIRGMLSIQDYPEEAFPYLRNLKIVGTFDNANLSQIPDCDNDSNSSKQLSLHDCVFCNVLVYDLHLAYWNWNSGTYDKGPSKQGTYQPLYEGHVSRSLLWSFHPTESQIVLIWRFQCSIPFYWAIPVEQTTDSEWPYFSVYADFYISITNSLLTSIDLSSLEEVRGSGVLLDNNPNLCFLGDFYQFINNSVYSSCASFQSRRDEADCGMYMVVTWDHQKCLCYYSHSFRCLAT